MSDGYTSMRDERRRARRNRIIFWSFVAILAVLFALFAKPVYHELKARRANQLASEAEALVGAGKLNEAASKYRAALQLDPLGYRPLLGAARLATRGGRPEASDLWQQVVLQPESTLGDRQDYAALLLQRGALSSGEKVLDELLALSPDAKTLSLAAQFASKQSDDARALEFARLAVTRAPEDDNMRFQLAEFLARSGEDSQRKEARQILWSLAGKSGPVKKAAVQALARAPELSPNEESRVFAVLQELPERDVISDLLAAELRLKLQPNESGKIYAEATARWGGGSAADLAELTRWFNLHGEAGRVLELIPLERALTNEPLLLSRLDAMANLKQWPEIEALLDRPDLGLDPAVTESFRARNCIGKGETLDAQLHWDRAITLSGGNAFKLRFVANFAEQSGATGFALKAYEQLARFPDQAALAQRARQRLLEANGDAAAARTAAERLATAAPDDVNAQAQLAHLNLLLAQEVDVNLARAKALVAKYPTRLSFRITAALGFLRANEPAAALEQFAGPPVEWARTPPGWRAVYAAVLAANGRGDEARELAGTIAPERLNKEERELLASIGKP